MTARSRKINNLLAPRVQKQSPESTFRTAQHRKYNCGEADQNQVVSK